MRPLALVLLLTSLAQAQPAPAADTDKAEALRLTDLGTQARQRGEAAAALAFFQDAYLIHPMPRLHLEIGLSQAAMGLDLQALLSFERFLKEGVDESPAAVEQARAEIAKLEKHIGVVEARAVPADAKLTLDGEALTGERVRVVPGVHRLTAERDGYQRVEQSLQVGAGETVRPVVKLMKTTPSDSVAAKPRSTWYIWTIAGVLAAGLVVTAVVLTLPTETKGPCDGATPGLGCVRFGGAP